MISNEHTPHPQGYGLAKIHCQRIHGLRAEHYYHQHPIHFGPLTRRAHPAPHAAAPPPLTAAKRRIDQRDEGPVDAFRRLRFRHCGKVQRAIQRAIQAAGPMVTTSVVMEWAYPRRLREATTRDRADMSRAIRIAASRLCERVGRSTTGTGRPCLWPLKHSGGK
jgi:hypothetical protein